MILRAGHTYGYWHHPSFVEEILAGLREGGLNWVKLKAADHSWVPVHTRDVAAAVALAVGKGEGIYLVTDGTCPSVGELLSTFFRVARKLDYPHVRHRIPRGSLPSPTAVHYEYRSDRAHLELGYTPRVSFEQGLPEVLEGLRQPDGEAHGNTATEFQHEGDESQGSVFENEARFWDEQNLHREYLYANPHDWRFDVRLGNILQMPVYRMIRRVMKRHRPRTALDLGCGTGIYPRVLAKRCGLKMTGVDLSPAQIAMATRLAELEGVSDLVDFEVANVLEYEGREKVDMITAFGALHHFPDIDEHLPGILERNLKPGGILLAVEPHYEDGYHPKLQRKIGRIAGSRFVRFFDGDRYLAVHAAAAAGESLRGESPAGRIFHKEELDLDAFLRSSLEPLDVRYIHAYAPYVANIYVVYMKVRWFRTLVRWSLPLVVRWDGWVSQRKSWKPYAAEALYTLRWAGPESRSSGSE